LLVLFGNFSEAEPKDLNDDLGDDESTEEYGYGSDSDLEDDGDKEITPPKASHNAPKKDPSEPRHESYARLTNKGKIVRIHDVAFVT